MDVDIFLQGLDLLTEIVVLNEQILSLLRLELELLRQLAILHDGQAGRCLLLLVVHSAQVRLRLLNFDEHFHTQSLGGLNAVPVHLRLRLVVPLDLVLQLGFELLVLALQIPSHHLEFLNVFGLVLRHLVLDVESVDFLFLLSLRILHLLFVLLLYLFLLLFQLVALR